MPDQDRLSALAMAQQIGARHLVIESNELTIPGYAQYWLQAMVYKLLYRGPTSDIANRGNL